MLFGFLYQMAKQNRLLKDNHQLDLFARPISVFLTGVGVIGIVAYALFAFLCPNKEACNSAHSYLVIVPVSGCRRDMWLTFLSHKSCSPPQIVSYILVRNCCGAVRQKYSTLFAWFGRISLEVSLNFEV